MARADIFENDEPDLDLADFNPKPAKSGKTPATREQVRAVTEANDFPSRGPIKPPAAAPQRRGRRTGRNIQLNIKITSETLNRFYRLSDENGWLLGETFEHALDALEKALEADGDRKQEAT
ncbi:MAG: hypothetical protein ABTQ27_17510 [Amaricoccus sp.]|uniref:hypothetical protein n=1 Tax=Amaricoccus sp. TaxID=1872485 RepID=UPI00331641B5